MWCSPGRCQKLCENMLHMQSTSGKERKKDKMVTSKHDRVSDEVQCDVVEMDGERGYSWIDGRYRGQKIEEPAPYIFLLVVSEKRSSLIFLRCLKTKQIPEICEELCSIFSIIGFPKLLVSTTAGSAEMNAITRYLRFFHGTTLKTEGNIAIKGTMCCPLEDTNPVSHEWIVSLLKSLVMQEHSVCPQ